MTPSPYRFVPMTAEHAETVAAWCYHEPYSFYDFRQDPEDLAELLDPGRREGRYFAALDEAGERKGFFSFEDNGSVVETGLGLKPSEKGQGLGRAFVQAGLAFAVERFHPKIFRLQAAEFNQRAIRVYQAAGFKLERRYRYRTNGGEYDFVSLVRYEPG
jgi:ribosomal-protein-alanine N-acetyltransferase